MVGGKKKKKTNTYFEYQPDLRTRPQEKEAGSLRFACRKRNPYKQSSETDIHKPSGPITVNNSLGKTTKRYRHRRQLQQTITDLIVRQLQLLRQQRHRPVLNKKSCSTGSGTTFCGGGKDTVRVARTRPGRGREARGTIVDHSARDVRCCCWISH